MRIGRAMAGLPSASVYIEKQYSKNTGSRKANPANRLPGTTPRKAVGRPGRGSRPGSNSWTWPHQLPAPRRRAPMIRRSRPSPMRRCTWPWAKRCPSPEPRCSGRCTSSTKAPAPPLCCSMSARLPSPSPAVRSPFIIAFFHLLFLFSAPHLFLSF